MGTPSNSLQNIYLGTVDVSRNNLIICLRANDKKYIFDQIINQSDETYEIIVFRKPKKQCEVCSFESPNSALMCEMCHMPFDYKSETLFNIPPEPASTVLPEPASTVLPEPAPTVLPDLIISSEQIFQEIQKCKYCTYESTNITDKCEVCEAPVSTIVDSSGWESVPKKVQKSNTNTTWINLGKSNDSVVSSVDDDTTTSVITESISKTDLVLQNKSINWKLYMKGWTAKECPFITNTVDDLITHINNAMCRARNCGYINHVDGIYQLGKSNTSAMVVFSTEIIANAAIKLDNNMLWNKSYLRLYRPQGYVKESNTSVIEIKMNIVREMEGVKLAPIFNPNEQKKKIQKKTKPVISNTNIVKKVEPIKYVLTNDQKVLIESIRSCMDPIDITCLENICSDENQDVIFSYDIVFKICNTFNNLKVFKCEPMHNQFIIKENGENKKSYIIERKPTGNITYYSVKYIKNILKAVNFPESEFSIKNVNVVSKKKEIVKIQSSKEQLDLVASLRATLRRNPLECLTIICCHDGRETSVFFDSLAELCTVLHDHKVIIAEINKTQIKIKNIGNITQPFCIEKRGKEHILQHAVAEVRRQLNNAYFPMWEFT